MNRAAAVRTSVRAGETGVVAGDGQTRASVAEAVENDDGERAFREWRLVDEACRASPTERAAIGRDEHERVVGQWIRPDVLGGKASSELDQHGGSRRVLAECLVHPRVVAMSNDDDGLVGAAGDDGDDVAELDLAEIGEICAPHVLLGLEPERRDRLPVPDGRLRGSLGPGHSRRVLRRQGLCERRGRRTVEQRVERRSL